MSHHFHNSLKCFAVVIAFIFTIGLYSPCPASAEWVLYDDFSSLDLDLNKWSRSRVHPDVDWEVKNGKLIITKKVGTVPVLKDSRLQAMALPADANGIKADVKIISFTNNPLSFDMKFHYDAGSFNMGDGFVDVYRGSGAKLKKISTNSFGSFLFSELEDVNVDNTVVLTDTATFYNDLESRDVVTLAIANDVDDTYLAAKSALRSGKTSVNLTVNNTSPMRGNYSAFRVCEAAPETEFVIEVDNVYIHRGDIVKEDTCSKTVVVPLM